MKKSSKVWTYDQITENAEDKIDHFLLRAKSARNEDEKVMFINWAFGIFCSWQALTQGWMNPGDRQRLELKIDEAQKEGC